MGSMLTENQKILLQELYDRTSHGPSVGLVSLETETGISFTALRAALEDLKQAGLAHEDETGVFISDKGIAESGTIWG